MVDLRTLRGRLALGYAVALTLALFAFAVVTLLVLDTVQRSTLDARLRTAAEAVLAIVDTNTGRIDLDDNDRRQFAQIVGAAIGGSVSTSDGHVVAANVTTMPALVRAALNLPRETKLAARGGDTLTTLASEGGSLRLLVHDVRASGGAVVGTVALWQSTHPIVQLDTRLALAFALMIPILAIIAVGAGSAIARRGLHPLEAMSAVAAEIEDYDLSRRLDTSGAPDELVRFATAFNRMLDRLEGTFARERQFTADASHELRTPLSVIRAEADLALMRERSAAEYQATLDTIAREADNLVALTTDLLALARSDAGVLANDDTFVDLAAVAHDVAQRLRIVADARETALVVDAEPAEAHGEAPVIARVVASVVQNAIKYGRIGSTVTISAHPDGEWARIAVRDDGAGFSPEALAHGLERFWRGSGARSDDGAGLGLSIARGLIEAYGGTISLANHPGGGALVTLRLPGRRQRESLDEVTRRSRVS